MVDLAEESHAYNNDRLIQYAEKALILSQKIDYKEGEANAQYIIGRGNLEKYNYSKVYKHLTSAVKIFKEINKSTNSVLLNP